MTSVSIYRLVWPDLEAAIRTDLEDVVRHDLDLAGHHAIRLDRATSAHPPDWAKALNEMTGLPFEEPVRSAAALLLIEIDDVAFALSFGHGRHLLDRFAWERDFGLHVALRTLRADRIAELARTTLDTTARLDLTNMPGGAVVRAFGIAEHAELVKRIAGQSDSLELSWMGGRPSRVRLDGRDALKLRVAVKPADLIQDLRTVQAAAELPAVPELSFMEGIRPVPPGVRRAAASEALNRELRLHDSPRLGFCLPAELLGQEVDGLVVESRGESRVVEEMTVEQVVSLLPAEPAEGLDALYAARVLVSVADLPAPVETSLAEWIAADLIAGDERYVFQQGEFYRVSDAYRETLHREAERLMSQPIGWELPAWPSGESERRYNERVGGDGGFVSLDRDLARTVTHPRGIEICDLISPDNQLVCVKRADRSAPLSHLFSQAVVAAEAILDGEQAWQELLARLPADRRAAVPRRPGFVFAIQLTKGELTPDSLFTFSQVTLYRAARHLHRLGMDVSVVAIPTRK
ncbi:DUF6119 family protein [Micromonospora sp. L31]|uniref:DUF6119 family protein n=1 Tax=Micromonospora sp. L31 TaxID=3452213 RepID=UPI003F8CAB4E